MPDLSIYLVESK